LFVVTPINSEIFFITKLSFKTITPIPAGPGFPEDAPSI